MKILHIVRSPVGGTFRHILEAGLYQARHGHVVGVAFDAATGAEHDIETVAGLTRDGTIRAWNLRIEYSITPRDVLSLWKLRDIVRNFRPDVIHAHGAKGGVLGRAVAHTLRRRPCTVYTPHGGSLHYSNRDPRGRAYFAIERLMLRGTDGLLHVCEYENVTFRQKVRDHSVPFKVVHNGVADLPDACVDRDFDFLYLGMLRDLKGTDVLLEAIAEVVHRGVLPRVLIQGSGDERDEARYREKAAAWGLSSFIRWQAASDPIPALRRSRVLVLPSRAESFPYVVLEAGMLGLGVIASRVGGISEVLDATTGWTVPSGHPHALADAMIHAMENPAQVAGRGSRLQARVKARFTQEDMGEGIMAFYGEVVSRSKGSR